MNLGTYVETENRERTETRERFFSADEVKKILNTDSQEIKRLCKQVSISPKRDKSTGKAFFLKNDVEILKKIKCLHEKGEQVMPQTATLSNALTIPVQVQNPDMKIVAEALTSAKDTIIDSVSKIIDEKLDGMDEVVVELIKCKAENERLKQKLNQITKDNYRLKNELESFKPVTMGLYIKSKINKPGLSDFIFN